MRDGQASSEYVILIAAVLLITLFVIYILQSSTSGVNEVKISESRAYWRSASPLRMDDWAVKSSTPDVNGVAAAQLAMVIANPTQDMVVLKKILVTGFNFTETYSRGANYAGAPNNLAPITFSPGETNTIVIIQTSGPAVPAGYEIWLDFDVLDQNVQKTQDGVVPLRGRTDFVSSSAASSPPGAGCSVGQIVCNTSGTVLCCGSGQVCSQGVTCCSMGQVACSGSCCAGSCFNGVCIPPGSNYCNWTGADCQIPNNCCSTGCISGPCPSPDYVISSIASNSTSLSNGEIANVTFITKNNGTLNATDSSYTRITIGTWASGAAVAPLLVGGEQEDSVEYTCNGLLSGWHSVVVQADANSEVGEFNESNNVATYFLQIYCAPASGPDLSAIEVFPADTTLLLGESANITINTTNVGGTTSGVATTTNINLVTDGTPSSFASLNVPVLASGAWNAQNFTFECNQSTAGTHVINATADYANAVNEGANENNNFYDSATIECTGPDLVVSTLTAAPGSLLVGEYSLIQFTVKNNGTADAPATNASLNATGGSGNPLSDTLFSIVSLTPGLTQRKVSLFTCNETFVGTWNITAYSDNASDVFETNETNNPNSTIVNCTAMDLEVGALSAADPNPIASGMGTVISVPLSNIGSQGREGDVWTVYPQASLVSRTGLIIGSIASVDVPKNGGAVDGTVNITCPDDLATQTTYTVNVSIPIVDGELNIDNNWQTFDIECEAGMQADLVVGPLDLVQKTQTVGGTISAGSGQTVDIEMPIWNGFPPKPGTWYFAPNLTATGGTFGTPPSMAVLKDGSITIGVFQYTCPTHLIANTTFQINASVDQMTDERTITNNYQILDILCLVPAPDLVVDSMAMTPDSPISISTSTTVDMAVTNIGNALSSPFDVEVYVSGGSMLPYMMNPNTFSLPMLFENQTFNQQFTYQCPAQNGTYLINATIQPSLNEINTANNNFLINITCNPVNVPDLVVYAPLASPASPILTGQSTTMSARIRNGGTAASGPFNLTYSATSGNVTPATYNYSTGIVADSAIQYKYFTYTCPATPGTYNVTVQASAATGETNTANNQYSAQISCVLGPDIEVLNLTTSTPTILANASAGVNVPVKNIGPGPSQAFNYTVTVTGGSFTYTQRQIPALGANSSTAYGQITFTCPATPGNYTITATAPQLNGETNTANNQNSTIITCTAPYADLAIATYSAGWWAYPNGNPTYVGCPGGGSMFCEIPWGQDFQLTYSTCNIGQLPAAATTTHRVEPGSYASYLMYGASYDFNIPAIGPSECGPVITEGGTCPIGAPYTTYDTHVYPDYTELVDEGPGEGFYIRMGVYCASPPDLKFHTIYATVTGVQVSSIPASTSATINMPLQNLGHWGIEDDQITLTVTPTAGSISGSPYTVVKGTAYDPLADDYEFEAFANPHFWPTVTYTCPSSPGTYTITASANHIDQTQIIPEINFTNNMNTFQINCT